MKHEPYSTRRSALLEQIGDGVASRFTSEVQIVSRLKMQPEIWGGVEPVGQAQRCITADGAFAVDDLADSGHTLNAVIHMLKNNYQPISELRSAVIWIKGVSSFTPDYSVEYLPTNPWIHQPFEGYDNLTPEKLLEKWKV